MSAARQLAENTLGRIQDHFGLREAHGADGGPYWTLVNAARGQPVGSLRILHGPPLEKLVYVSLVVSQIGLDSHMLFAFAPSTSAVPHFTLDSVWAGDSFAFHLDLVPRVDLAAHLPYLDAVLEPLTEHFLSATWLEGLQPARLRPRQVAQMSPWMLAYRADEAAFTRIGPWVHAYLTHWLGLFNRELPTEVDSATLAQRDRCNRRGIFNPAVDPVWGLVERIIGAEAGARLRRILIQPEIGA